MKTKIEHGVGSWHACTLIQVETLTWVF